MNALWDYPRTWVVRDGVDAGKVLIQWAARGPYCLVGPDGGVTERYRPPLSCVLAAPVCEDSDGAA